MSKRDLMVFIALATERRGPLASLVLRKAAPLLSEQGADPLHVAGRCEDMANAFRDLAARLRGER